MKFEMAEIKIEKFEIMDVITTSGGDEEDCLFYDPNCTDDLGES